MDTATVDDQGSNAAPSRARDASNTRQLLLNAARDRFAKDGYAATSVRDIATDAGVNVALINRYFDSKEGLFEACLTRAADELGRANTEDIPVEQMAKSIIHQIAGSSQADTSQQLLLLLRTSGDERADLIRRNTLKYFAERMASAAGWRRNEVDTAQLLLRAQIVLSTSLGFVLLRSTSGLEPMSSASENELAEPMGDFLAAMFENHPRLRGAESGGAT